MVRTTTDADRTEFETHDDAVDVIQSGDVEAGDTIEVEYADVNGDKQTEVGTVTDAEVVEAGTVHGTEPRTWETSTTHYTVEYEVGGKNDHKVTGELGGDAPTVYTEVGGRHSDGGDRRKMGDATGVAVEDDGEAEPDVDHDPDEWCGRDECPSCQGYDEPPYSPDPEHADHDFDVEDIRHVSPDREPKHLVVADADDVALCGTLVGGLTTFGDAADTPEEAARLGAWVNVNDDVCNDCADAVNDMLFDG
jgi:hypothetical protein